MEKEVLVKTIKKVYSDKIKAGIIWFKFISAINNIHLAKRELQLMAFMNYRGTISSLSAKEEFCKMFGSSPATISNMVSKRLLPLKVVVKEKGKIKVHPALRVDFDKEFVIRFFMGVQEEEVKNAD